MNKWILGTLITLGLIAGHAIAQCPNCIGTSSPAYSGGGYQTVAPAPTYAYQAAPTTYVSSGSYGCSGYAAPSGCGGGLSHYHGGGGSGYHSAYLGSRVGNWRISNIQRRQARRSSRHLRWWH